MRNALSGTGSRLVAALDIGTTKISCAIAEQAADGSRHLVGLGHHRAQGMRSGQIVNMEAAQHCLAYAVSAAEEAADTKISQVHVNLSAGSVRSSMLPVEMPLRGETIDDGHIKRLLGHARDSVVKHSQQTADEPTRYAIHAIPLEFTVDGERGIKDPRGMVGSSLGAPCHLISASLSALQNLNRALENCHLSLSSITVSPIAAAQAALSDDEKDLGTTIIDLGGGTTGMAIYQSGSPCYAEILPVGGRHVTGDIANVLPTTLIHGERLKTSYGRAFVQPGDERSIVEAPTASDEANAEMRKISVSFLNQVIEARLEEIFETIAERLNSPSLSKFAGRRVVLTGGGALMPGIKDIASRVLQKDVRIGRPSKDVFGGIDCGPEMSTLLGLLNAPHTNRAPAPVAQHKSAAHPASTILNAGMFTPMRRLFGL